MEIISSQSFPNDFLKSQLKFYPFLLLAIWSLAYSSFNHIWLVLILAMRYVFIEGYSCIFLKGLSIMMPKYKFTITPNNNSARIFLFFFKYGLHQVELRTHFVFSRKPNVFYSLLDSLLHESWKGTLRFSLN